MNLYILSVIVTLFTVTIITRFLPFIFTKQITQNAKLKVLGPKLPAYIMLLLLIYQIHPAETLKYPYILLPLLSLTVVFTAHKLIKKPLVSILLGTLCYYLLMKYLIGG